MCSLVMSKFGDRDLWSVLSTSHEEGHPEIAVRLLEHDDTLTEARSSNGQTPLSWSARTGQDAIVKLLLEKEADVNFRDVYQRTPLSWAAKNGHETVAMLLGNGADVNSKDNYGWSPLFWASMAGHERAIQLLLQVVLNPVRKTLMA